ncbi:NUDIX hydrolase [Bacillus sp. B-jedd]|uniref:NUDIX hydrolase n=1 Tax=Bacillus sp. B-jedd TaxID=1476857 RepID=UPI0005156AF5|nr:NUDIX hydrolase [Bacillus sp. B-jedd]CEG27058.1 MutT/NUDIX family protein [Bacillus sp. B-jedd]
MDRADVVYGLIFDKETNQVLMVNNVGSGWTLPGGMVEKGEILTEGLVREVYEETGLTVEARELLAVKEAFRPDRGHHVLFFTFAAYVSGGTISIQFPEEIIEVKWVDVKTANSLMPYYEEGIERLLQRPAAYKFLG